MAKTSMKIKQARPAKFSTREYSRCRICGRPHAYLKKYGICRICFRELAYKGQIPGVKKASWQAPHTQRTQAKRGVSLVEWTPPGRYAFADVEWTYLSKGLIKAKKQ